MSGKGSKPRPIKDRQKFNERWDAIKWNHRDDKGCVLCGAAETRAVEETDPLCEQHINAITDIRDKAQADNKR